MKTRRRETKWQEKSHATRGDDDRKDHPHHQVNYFPIDSQTKP